jgi:isoleucyl-tRNA synthetase
MPFDYVPVHVNLPAQENAILELWDKIHAFEQLRTQNRGKSRWSFLDGPITANNPMGVHHAWGRTYKDAYQRYFAMTGHDERYQNGFDCQGLWVEVEVEKELRLGSKRDIENLVPGDRFASIDRFVQLCKERVDKYARIQTNQSIRLGYWMDWDRTDEDWARPPDERKSYFTMSEENNYTIWSFLKKCHERGLVHRGYDAMPWCGRCGVGLSQMEMHEGYLLVAHRSVFVKFPLRRAGSVSDRSSPVADAPGLPENLLVWTTTPWTLSSNVAAAVNPQLTYLRIKHEDEVYYLAKGALTAQRLEEQFKRKEWIDGVPKLRTLEQIFKEKGGYEVLGELPGTALVGWQYAGPFDEVDAQAHSAGFPAEIAEVVRKQGWGPDRSSRDIHRVVAWNMVGEAEGTGIVHIAPGCGKEDFQLGKEQGLVPIAPLDDAGTFVEGFGALTGRSALDHATTDWILANLEQKGVLFAVERYPHNYPHCWRCKTELLFRLVDEWFIDMKWREEIMRVTEQVTFLPEAINGKARELDWLKNMGDWMISKKRFWGLALPIWVCGSCSTFDVIGGRDELKRRAVAGWDKFEGHSPHRPWIDLVTVKCAKCSGTMNRVPDVGNPWLDAGIVPFSTMGYNKDRARWEKWFPADFITESFPGQFRNWFYAILAMSTMMVLRGPFKVLLGHGQVRDQKGEEMHKSKGNAIPFGGAADDGYELFHERDPKLSLEKQAARDLPPGWKQLTEEPVRIEKREFVALKGKGYPPMGADLIRWMFCRNNPAANINFGPVTAEELRSKFIVKLWNSYAFFCDLARQGGDEGFDPHAPLIPVRDRPDMDRWILSDLQGLIEKANDAFKRYSVMDFCLAAEEFIEDKLSNWYVRTQKDRFWAAGKSADKQAAFQTLYAVLTSLARLCAPVVPFLTEAMYQNLIVRGLGDNVCPSVHLGEYPTADPSLIDAALSEDTDALLRIVSLGRAVRNVVKIKVRQPLAELKIQPGSDADRRAVERFPEHIKDELNLKRVTLHDANAGGPLLSFEYKLNPKNAGPKFGPLLGQVQTALTRLAAESAKRVGQDVAAVFARGESVALTVGDGTCVTLEPTDVWVLPKTEKSFGGLVDRGTQFLLDARITPELAREGMAREVVRHVQQSRKEAELQMADRIELHLGAEGKLSEAIAAHHDRIAADCLVGRWSDAPLGAGAFRAEVKIEGQPLVIELRRLV